MSADTQPHLRDGHTSDKYGTKLVDKAGELQEKAQNVIGKHGNEDKKDGKKEEPAGGYDDTGIPDAPPGYTIRITFHRAENLPFSDFPSFSSDPYIHATLKTSLRKRHRQDPDLVLRTPTIHRNVNPKWETQWVIAHVPESGFFLKCRLYDEDPADHDDRLGNIHVNVGRISENWQGIDNQPYDLKKRMASKRAYTFRGMAALFRKGVKMSGRLYVSVENLGRSPGNSGGICYTVAPLPWSRHHSPLIGRIAGTKDREEAKDGKKSVERYNFQAVQMQLKGPIPAPMYHRYVEFKPFVSGMFTDATIRGRILNRAAHHQHARIYNYDGSTVYGIFEKPCIELTRQFLEFVHYDQGGRIYTYVLSLDGLWRFTETGKEFGIDMLSKHTMHSDVSIYIAFSGEFFIRRLKHSRKGHGRSTSGVSDVSQHSNSAGQSNGAIGDVAPPRVDHENETNSHGEHSHEDISKNPSDYELIIDNDSGTYRPNAKLLPLLRDFLAENLPGLRIATLDCQGDEELMNKLKSEQRERKEKSGKQITYMQNSSMSSLSSSDEEKLDAIASGKGKQSAYKRKLNKFQDHRAKEHQHLDQNTSYTEPEQTGSENTRPISRDSRDASSSNTEVSNREQGKHSLEADGQRRGSGYENRELPHLLKKDTNGHLSAPQKQSESEKFSYGDAEKGDNKPSGGIAYNQVVSTAAMEKSKEKNEDKSKDKDQDKA